MKATNRQIINLLKLKYRRLLKYYIITAPNLKGVFFIMYNELLKFLKSNKTQCKLTITKYRRNDTLLIIKYYYDDNNILLYTQSNYENDLDINKKLEYSEFYNLKSNTFYDTRI